METLPFQDFNNARKDHRSQARKTWRRGVVGVYGHLPVDKHLPFRAYGLLELEIYKI